jgi:hypothetical protein
MIAEDDDRAKRIEELQSLFRSTQVLPQAKAITEKMIVEEVEAYHNHSFKLSVQKTGI